MIKRGDHIDGPHFPSSSGSDNMDNLDIYNGDKLNNYIDCSNKDFPISDLSSVLCNMYSSSERITCIMLLSSSSTKDIQKK